MEAVKLLYYNTFNANRQTTMMSLDSFSHRKLPNDQNSVKLQQEAYRQERNMAAVSVGYEQGVHRHITTGADHNVIKRSRAPGCES